MARFLLYLLASCVLHAQDVRSVTSPDGKLEFRIFITQPPGAGLSQLAYQVFDRGARLVDTSYLGIDITDQEPLLGQNIGLMESSSKKTPDYNELRARYMQNGSLGRLLEIEVRAYDSKVEFRYVVPLSTPLAEPFTVDDEKTEFNTVGKVQVTEEDPGTYPTMTLVRDEGPVQVTRLAARFPTKAPFTTPWRIITITR